MLEFMEFSEKGVGSNGKNHTSRRTSLNNASKNQIEKTLEAPGHVNGIVKMKQGLKKRNKARGEAIRLENS